MTQSPAPRMAPFEHRRLTGGELIIARCMFADEAPFARTRIFQAPPLGFGAAAPASRVIVFSHWRAARDFAAAPLAEQGWFVHELTHVWQALAGVVTPLAKLHALGAAAYAYALAPGKPLRAYNIEQQAEIARHLFLARRGAPEPGAPAAGALEAIWPVKS